MSLTISKDYIGFSTCGVSGHPRESRTETAGADTAERERDRVELSADSRIAASCLLKDLLLPTEENIRRMSAALSTDIGSLLMGKGISPQPPIEFTISPTGAIQVEGDRADKEQILTAVNGNEKVSREIRNTAALASHAAAMAESLKFQKEYLASSDPESIVAKYSYLFGSVQPSHRVSLVYDGAAVSVLSDGREWLSSLA